MVGGQTITSARTKKKRKKVDDSTHCDDVIFSETQFVVVVPLKVQQRFGPSPSVARHHQEVLVVLLVTLH